jgi:ABC-2 type transport system ATP-binding protein
MIELIGITKIYRGLKAVDGINLTVERGVLFGFLGPNGAGKTTTIKMMAGVLKPTEGVIKMGGFDIAAQPEAAKQIVGYIPDRPFVYEKLTAKEFLDFVADLYLMERGKARENRIAALLDLFELRPWAQELIEGYSHGMKQRLVMCSALLTEPRILVVDEPMVGLDPRGARLVKNLFQELCARGVTVFMSTHSLSVAEEVCEEIAIIQKGRITARGTAAELRAKAQTDGSLEDAFLKLTEEM